MREALQSVHSNGVQAGGTLDVASPTANGAAAMRKRPISDVSTAGDDEP